MRNYGSIVLKTVATVVVGVPLLLVATCAYTSFSPHLRFDPILAKLMDAPMPVWWNSVDVPLTPDEFQIGEQQAQVFARLQAAGFNLIADYSTGPTSRDLHVENKTPQTWQDREYASSKKVYNALGVTHVFQRDGRGRPACGENLTVKVGFADGALTQISGNSHWTCM